MGSFVIRKKLVWILLIFLVASMAGSFVYYSSESMDGSSQNGQTEQPEIQQAVARTGSITESTSGSGTLVPAWQTELSFQNQGELVELNVKVGDSVQAGDVLARMQVDKSPAELAAEVTSANLAVVRAQQNLDSLYKNANLERAQALISLEEAQHDLDDLNSSNLDQAQAQQALVQAKKAVQDAGMQVYILNSSPSQEDMDVANASLMFKEKNLQDIQNQVDKIEHEIKVAPDIEIRARLKTQLLSLQAKLAQQQIAVDQAKYSLDTMDDPPDPSDMDAAQARLSAAELKLSQAQKIWEESQEGPNAGIIAMAESNLTKAQSVWQNWKDGPNPDDIALAEAQLAKARAKLAQVQKEQLVLDLIAPVDGKVLSVNAETGDRITNQVIVSLADLTHPSLEVHLDETDLEKAKVGYTAQVVFDTLPDETFIGKVMEIDPILISTRGSSAVKAQIQLDDVPSALLQKLPIGLNATVDIIAGEVDHAVLVPVEAVHEIDPGQYAVYVLQGTDLELRQVTIGLQDFTSIQILSGLVAGEPVALGEIGALESTP